MPELSGGRAGLESSPTTWSTLAARWRNSPSDKPPAQTTSRRPAGHPAAFALRQALDHNPKVSILRREVARARFDRIFGRKTGFLTLDRLLARLSTNKQELLMVLDRPEVPLHTNGSENEHPLPRDQAQGQRRHLE